MLSGLLIAIAMFLIVFLDVKSQPEAFGMGHLK